MTNRFVQYFENSFRENWDLPAMTNYETKQMFKYKDIVREIAKLHVLFEELDISQNDKIAILGDNSPEWVIVYLSTITYGAIVVPVLQTTSLDDQINVIGSSESVLLFADYTYGKRIKYEQLSNIKAVFRLSDLQCFYCSRENEFLSRAISGYLPKFFEKYSQGVSPEHMSYTHKNEDDVVIISFTSGSQGNTKGVMLTSKNFNSFFNYIDKVKLGDVGNRFVSILPLSHMFGAYHSIFCALTRGAHVYYLPNLKQMASLSSIYRDIKPTNIEMVPMMLENMVSNVLSNSNEEGMTISSILGGCVEMVIIAGASLDPKIEEVMKKNKTPYTVVYGSTECSLITSEMDHIVMGSVGRAVDGVSIEIDSDDPYSIPGEILVKGDNIMKGYYRRVELTNSVHLPNGWFRTGDLGVIDKDGYLYILGRCDSMILTSSGQNVYPENIEMELNKSPYILESLVVLYRNRIVALVYPDFRMISPGVDIQTILEKERKVINSRLASYECVSEFIIRKDPFEKTHKNNIKRYLYQNID